MDIQFQMKDRMLIVHIQGEIDHHTCNEIRDKLDHEIKKQNALHIIFDFSNIQFMDSSGIGVIIGRYRNLQSQGGRVGIVKVNSQVDRIFELSGLYKIIPKYFSIDEAVSNL